MAVNLHLMFYRTMPLSLDHPSRAQVLRRWMWTWTLIPRPLPLLEVEAVAVVEGFEVASESEPLSPR